MQRVISRILCGEELSEEAPIVESIRRLFGFCQDIAVRLRNGTAVLIDAEKGIAFAQELNMMLVYYRNHDLTGLDDTDIFLAEEIAQAVVKLSISYVRSHND